MIGQRAVPALRISSVAPQIGHMSGMSILVIASVIRYAFHVGFVLRRACQRRRRQAPRGRPYIARFRTDFCRPGRENVRGSTAAHHIGIVVFNGVKLLDVAGPSEVFSEANRMGATTS